MSLTGRSRHRGHSRWFRAPLLVLQVQDEVSANEGTTTVKIWRDAGVEDLAELEREQRERYSSSSDIMTLFDNPAQR